MQKGFLSERKGKVIPCRGPETEKALEPTVERLVGHAMNLETETDIGSASV